MQVGSNNWLRQHDALERLNIQAHQSAQCRSDEYIVEALVTQQRLSCLVHELLAAEVGCLLFPGFLHTMTDQKCCDRGTDIVRPLTCV